MNEELSVLLNPSPVPFHEALERLRLTAGLAHQEWLDLLGVQWKDYFAIKAGTAKVTEKMIERLAQHFNFRAEELAAGKIDFRALAKVSSASNLIPDKYSKAAFGRRRTSITSVDFLEARFGWRLRLDSLNQLGVSEAALDDAFAPISMKFITDLTDYLKQRQFTSEDFFAMGAYSFVGNKNSLVGKILGEMRSPPELFEFWCDVAVVLYEQNCTYSIRKMNQDGLILDVLSDPHVAEASGVHHLGNCHICDLKRGIFSQFTLNIGLSMADVKETACVHRGDSVCRFEVDFRNLRALRFRPLVKPDGRPMH